MIKSKLFSMFTNKKFRNQLMITYLLVMMIPVSVVGLFSYNESKQSLIDQKGSSLEYTIKQIKTNIENKLKYYREITSIVVSNKTMNVHINNSFEDDLARIEGYRYISEFLNTLMINNSVEINNIVIYSDNRLLYHDDKNIRFFDDEYVMSELLEQIQNSNNSILWASPGKKGNKYLFSVFRVLDYNFEKSSILELVIDEDSLFRLIEDEIHDKDIFISNEDGIIMTSSQRENIGLHIGELGLGLDILGENSGKLYKGKNGQQNIVVFNTTADGWKVISYAPTNILLEGIEKIKRYILFTSIISVIFAGLITLVFSRGFEKRIQLLTRKMEKIQEGDFDTTINISGEDELGNLGRSFDIMKQKLKDLFDEINESNRQKHEAEIEALHSQINSHFLYNTLSSIRWLSCKYKVDEIKEIVDMLSTFYRIALGKNSEMISIRDELEHLKAYVFLQKIRYGDLIDVEYDIDDGILSYSTVKLVLQPFVENAIFHGRSEEENKVNIVVKGYFFNNKDIVFEITDNGIGIRQEVLQSINKGEYKRKGGGYGVINVYKRIKLYFGDEYGVKLFSTYGEGTKAVITIPGITQEIEKTLQ